jgi:hypothetical protein
MLRQTASKVALFAVERQAKDVSAAERLELRQKQSVAILAELHWKLLIQEQLLPKHPMAEAVNYWNTRGRLDRLGGSVATESANRAGIRAAWRD